MNGHCEDNSPPSIDNNNPLIAMVGNPNTGKSALFNALTGAHQKVGNYPGVTVERKYGHMALPDGRPVEVVDLPGTYSLDPGSADERVTRDVLFGQMPNEKIPDILLVVLDATNLGLHLRFALQLLSLKIPTVFALNMVDMAERDGLKIDINLLSEKLGAKVIPTVAVRRRGIEEVKQEVAHLVDQMAEQPSDKSEAAAVLAASGAPVLKDISSYQPEAQRLTKEVTKAVHKPKGWTQKIDDIVLHPILGPIILAGLMFFMFQAVFAWSQTPIGWIEDGFTVFEAYIRPLLPEGLIRSLIVDGVIAGVGSVLVFLPQILILFLFILLLEGSGYMVRAAFLMDRLMAKVGLTGRAFIPLLSSFACAIPGIMATRSIEDPKSRLTTILIAPLMTCSARLPVYSVLIGAFVPDKEIGLKIGLQGLVMFLLYVAGIVAAMLVALIFRYTLAKGKSGLFLIEMPRYQMPILRDIMLGLWQRAMIFLKRAGTIILTVSVALWAVLAFPRAPEGVPQSEYSIAGRIAAALDPIMKPAGFNHAMTMAVIPAMAAREVAVSALATVYSIDSSDEEKTQESLIETLRKAWPLSQALAFLAWFVFAPQCLSTIAVIRRETNGWKWPLFTLGYLFTLAYVASTIVFHVARMFGL
ncbi:MAG: ferrous iron transport protein B [Zymomonas mobilis]|uniref:ferrous iron transport protein B n=1 Tax=Zymomonas mobilis TaxID=542 RepID=UPI0001B707E5|nr:ferrous iron transport protein B [Zymomonas mobilis]ACV76200.1 ferrous iron transport protein B [Zymomonas mobilis subsp. mobilis NCIMB 11163]